MLWSQVEWPSILVCLQLQDFFGCGIFSAKSRRVLGKWGCLVSSRTCNWQKVTIWAKISDLLIHRWNHGEKNSTTQYKKLQERFMQFWEFTTWPSRDVISISMSSSGKLSSLGFPQLFSWESPRDLTGLDLGFCFNNFLKRLFFSYLKPLLFMNNRINLWFPKSLPNAIIWRVKKIYTNASILPLKDHGLAALGTVKAFEPVKDQQVILICRQICDPFLYLFPE